MGLPGDILQMQIGQVQRPFVPTVDFTGRTIIITGANTGLGFEAAKHLSAASLPPYLLNTTDLILNSYSLNVSHLILACRNMTRGENARKEIITSGGTSSRVKVEV